MSTKRPKLPSLAIIEWTMKTFERDEKYSAQNRALETLFCKKCPSHARMGDVLSKVSALNDIYSANVFDTYAMATHIVSLKPGRRISRGDLEIVNEIACVGRGSKKRCHYSFATKYCSVANRAVYPIYDSFVDKMLRYFRKKDRFAKFQNADLKDYPTFVWVLAQFREFYGLERVTARQLDVFLWQEGKRVFRR